MPVSAVVVACGSGDVANPSSGSFAGPPTYHADVAPVLAARCGKCHVEGGIAPFPLQTYEQARDRAPLIIKAVTQRIMPPWGAQDTPECHPPLPWREDERMTDAEIALLQDWAAAGSLAGDPSVAHDTFESQPSLDLVNPTLDLGVRQAFTPTGSGDLFRCFVLDAPDYDVDRFITAIHLIPGNRRVVHHADVFADTTGDIVKRAGPDGSFDCELTDPFVPEPPRLLAWAPGLKPVRTPSDAGIRLPAHSKLFMQVHYSPGGVEPAPDPTRVQIQLLDAQPAYTVWSGYVGNFDRLYENGDGLQPAADDPPGEGPLFRIPAGARKHVEWMVGTVAQDYPIWVYAVRAHQHLAGVDVKLEIEHAHEQRTECLLQDRWDFHWQRTYAFDAPTMESLPRLHQGDKIKIRCTYDNSMMNPRLAQEYAARGLQPVDLFLGATTLDEMCSVELLLAVKN